MVMDPYVARDGGRRGGRRRQAALRHEPDGGVGQRRRSGVHAAGQCGARACSKEERVARVHEARAVASATARTPPTPAVARRRRPAERHGHMPPAEDVHFVADRRRLGAPRFTKLEVGRREHGDDPPQNVDATREGRRHAVDEKVVETPLIAGLGPPPTTVGRAAASPFGGPLASAAAASPLWPFSPWSRPVAAAATGRNGASAGGGGGGGDGASASGPVGAPVAAATLG